MDDARRSESGRTYQAALERLPEGLVGDHRRKCLIRCLAEQGGTSSLGTLARHVAEAEHPDSRPPAVSYQSVYLDLRRLHVPLLQTLDVLVYDETDGTVSFHPSVSE